MMQLPLSVSEVDRRTFNLVPSSLWEELARKVRPFAGGGLINAGGGLQEGALARTVLPDDCHNRKVEWNSLAYPSANLVHLQPLKPLGPTVAGGPLAVQSAHLIA